MNRKPLIFLLVLVAAAAGAAWLISRGRTASWENGAGEGANILSFDPNAVDEVDITGPGSALNLVNKNGAWTVHQRDDYPADFDQVASLIRGAWELKPAQSLKAGPSQLPRLGLAPPGAITGAGTLVKFKGKDGALLASLLLGKQFLKKPQDTNLEIGGAPMGRYVMSGDGKNRVFLVSRTLDEFDPRPDRWIDRDFIKVENIRAIAVSGTSPSAGWQIGRDSITSIWKLLDPKPGEQLNLPKTSAFAGFLSNPYIVDVLAPDTKASVTGLDKPITVDLVTFDHFSYRLKIGKPIAGNYPVEIQLNVPITAERRPDSGESPADKAKLDEEFQAAQTKDREKLAKEKKFEGHIYLVARATLDPVLQDRSQITLPYTPPPATVPKSPAPSASPAVAKPSPSPGVTVATRPVAAPTPQPSPARTK